MMRVDNYSGPRYWAIVPVLKLSDHFGPFGATIQILYSTPHEHNLTWVPRNGALVEDLPTFWLEWFSFVPPRILFVACGGAFGACRVVCCNLQWEEFVVRLVGQLPIKSSHKIIKMNLHQNSDKRREMIFTSFIVWKKRKFDKLKHPNAEVSGTH